MNVDKTGTLESLISTAEYVIGDYLKDHDNCFKEELMTHVLGKIGLKEDKQGNIVIDYKPIHMLAWLIALKELEKEGIIQVNRNDLAFPLIDNRSRFSLKH